MARRRKQPPPSPPSPPPGLETVWAYFRDLDAGRGSGGFGPAALDYRQILAWTQLTGCTPTPDEVRLILCADRAYTAAMQAELKLKQE